MDVGVVYFFTDKGPDPVEFAQAAEGYGFESLFIPEHTHFPASRETDYPIEFGGPELPEFYLRTYDQMVTMSVIAARTERLTLGTGVTLLAQHDPIAKAKEFATLDHLTGGRIICGVGFGWNVEEARAHGVVWKNRYSIVRDKYHVMKALWTQDTASFTGRRASLEPTFAWPKTTNPAGIRTYVGGAGPMAMRQAAEWGDVWYVVPPVDDPTLTSAIPRFRQVVEEAGRDPESVPVSVASAPPDPAVLEKYREQGVERAVLWVEPADTPGDGMRNLEAVSKVLKSVS
ncbi:LLM class F420-dependent oxidoreductase [Amycolatopsis thermoflava]|uniref:LLM class F420-dependent oxidoreductase n=1 Tax=Amycolatopsis thermoflava TaxID=84480 RepID=UPI003D74C548